ncbi:hypothetical protein [Paenibacillus radicis (ex Gao et al. 2016)]|uniref:Uncharacterized protein n=1 Tax=Paenibacillus radicis (ex Gao et al. 2016) TaxID=1737354 RepID=A0A917M578_9BACL|nr:hypothetical protein [Paenibacillus radicis (ex Gao et al. 2016)]GGG79622.1 hypothetical protein GCM10010918_40860 [Paenibacillus radicis (ex Gao et al. 2016)]
MKLIRRFFLVVLNLTGELWIGAFHRTPDFYDKHTASKTKAGYFAFVALVTVAVAGIAVWLSIRGAA